MRQKAALSAISAAHEEEALHQYATCDIRLVTGCGPWENSGPTYRMSEGTRNRGIADHLDDWGPEGGHGLAYWHHQLWEYVGAHF